MVKIDNGVRLILLQFRLAKRELLPQGTSMEERPPRENHRIDMDGVQIIESTERSFMGNFVADLAEAKYELVQAFHQERVQGAKPYWIVRFVFACKGEGDSTGDTGTSDRFSKELEALRDMCLSNLWRVRVYRNPYFQNGEKVKGESTLSVNLEARTPLYRPDGKPVKVWTKDAAGERIGEEPLPITPDHLLRVVDNVVQLETA